MTGMDDLTTWLRAQLDDDERVARACPFRDWRTLGPPGTAPTLCGRHGNSNAHLAEPVTFHDPKSATLAHAARWDPARVLAEIDAKRRIIDAIERRLDRREPDGGWESAGAETDGMADTTLRLLALPYADRPGYRSEWAP
jgi:hypothetical protein